MRLFADFTAYKYEDSSDKCFVEIYYNLLRNDLKYLPDSLGYIAVMNFRIALSDTAGNPLDSLSWKAGSRIGSLSILDESDYLISDVFAEVFNPGDYNIDLRFENGGNVGSASFRMNVPRFSDTELAVSSIEWAFDISADSNTVSKLTKYGYHVVPNASGQFAQENNIIYLYAEAYNFDVSPDAESSYTVAMNIYDSRGELYKAIKPVSYHKPGKSAVIITGFSIAAFDGGLYRLKLAVTDGSRMVETEKSFSVILSAEKVRQKVMQAVLNEYPGAQGIQTEEDAKKFHDNIVFIATSDELELYDSLNLEGKKNFQKEFWAGRDSDASTPVNEFQLEHYRRLKYVEERFSRHMGVIPGWKTDQGRVYILYGEPSEIERSQSSIETRSWEKWWYHGLEGGVYFIFVDYEDTDSYVLIHSTKKNEIQDENWEDKIRMTVFQR